MTRALVPGEGQITPNRIGPTNSLFRTGGADELELFLPGVRLAVLVEAKRQGLPVITVLPALGIRCLTEQLRFRIDNKESL
jgi:hypothetical protein